MKKNLTRLGLASVLVIAMMGCAAVDSGDDFGGSDVGTHEQVAGPLEAVRNDVSSGANARALSAAEGDKLAKAEAVVSSAAQVDKSEERDPEDSELSNGILDGDKDEGADSEAEYLNCNGWAAGGRKCNVQCAGFPWLYTGWSYPAISNGQCNAKADKFCWDHWSYRVAACWGT
jgi:hypothetical protein